MRFFPLKALVATAVVSAFAGAAHADPQCELKRPVKFGGMNWESNLVLVDVERFILEKGYGCKTEVLPTETLPALAALERGDLDINTEIWLNSVAEPWDKAEKGGKVKRVGDVYMGGEAWFIPRYTAERYPELKSAADLPKFKDKFKDPEEPGKGRFYGCPAGWGCEVTSTNLFNALKLGDDFTLYSPGTGAAQKAALTSAYKRKQDVVFYYWYPTPLVGAMDLVKLELPPYDAEKHKCLTAPKCDNPEPSAYPDNPVFTAVNTKFAGEAPQLTEFLSKVSVPNATMDATLAHMESSGDDASDVAEWFLKNQGDVWKKWVPADVATRVEAAL
ncbi:glycine/betaine ABC transporter substrate-binding protein [Bordetella trematum]|uniref:Glycine betaine/L-proline ABC transporter substrate-binding periplasmic protein n=1 Tax=Bordetella trematum TaxID=123899 RepID=A0A157SVQ1_9BORD|nr:ABC transporter substrate-binding protein [Bordetella trematum]AUL47937.1 glycine/betaine ABC transporter substrate-binding protein [Bordetella trematum]AZR94857.1 glycine/betaine ABC transporter substrate-binding protein [Bordetella trematum]NNH20098.1 ABC transporter substrate-binding protein [Bordetella trematum]QIM73366.1 ABC transporter substrate-binding protein [Bordetella trematum]SAH93101.1 glycine betaine/L-proline ABC transporter substrate-binding periplasmic protein [Bordetella t